VLKDLWVHNHLPAGIRRQDRYFAAGFPEDVPPMRTRMIVAAAALLLAIAPAQAAGLTGMGRNLHGSYFNFAKANLPSVPISSISVGGLKVKLQSTRLKDVVKKFGGSLQQADGATWVCYHDGAANTWFISNALGGQDFVMMVAVEANKKAGSDCGPAPAGFTLPQLGIPGLGATAADLKASFGAASGSTVAYRHDRPGGYSDTAQYVGYVLKSGKVTGYGAGETQIPSAAH
jgi:hypothetical protein